MHDSPYSSYSSLTVANVSITVGIRRNRVIHRHYRINSISLIRLIVIITVAMFGKLISIVVLYITILVITTIVMGITLMILVLDMIIIIVIVTLILYLRIPIPSRSIAMLMISA